MIYTLKCVNNLKPAFSDEHEENRAIIEAVNSLMLATGVYRLFTKDDFKVFFERLYLITSHYSIIDRFFQDETFMYIVYHGKIMTLETSDIFNCIGLCCGSSPRKNVDRDFWIKNMHPFINDSILEALDNNLIVLIQDFEVQKKTIGNIEYNELVFKNNARKLTEQDYKNAQVFSKSIINDLPAILVEKWNKLYPDAISEHDKEAESLSNYPSFRFWELDTNQLNIIEKHFSELQPGKPLDARKMMLPTHLAWAYANDFVYHYDNGLAYVADFVWLDGDSICREEAGYNFDEINETYQLEELYPTLRVIYNNYNT